MLTPKEAIERLQAEHRGREVTADELGDYLIAVGNTLVPLIEVAAAAGAAERGEGMIRQING